MSDILTAGALLVTAAGVLSAITAYAVCPRSGVKARQNPAGVFARTAQRLLTLATAIWNNWNSGATVKRSLTAYDH